jgi:hypothetical protein
VADKLDTYFKEAESKDYHLKEDSLLFIPYIGEGKTT